MLAPESLSSILGEPVARVTRQPLDVRHLSGNHLERITAGLAPDPRRGEGEVTGAPKTRQRSLVLKRFDRRDWVMRLTHDDAVREVALFRGGLFGRLPQSCRAPILAAARDGDSWASLMADVSPALAPALVPVVDADDARAWLVCLAELHARFWNDASLARRELGLASLEDFVTILSPERVQGELEAGRTHPVLEMAARGWRAFDQSAPPDVRAIIHKFQRDPAELLDILTAMPQTLVHGDFKLANLGMSYEPGGQRRAIILDWQDAARGPGVLDLGYFLALDAARLTLSEEQAAAVYRDALTARGFAVSARELDVGLLAGGALRLLWRMTNHAQSVRPGQARAREELEWWYDLVRRFD